MQLGATGSRSTLGRLAAYIPTYTYWEPEIGGCIGLGRLRNSIEFVAIFFSTQVGPTLNIKSRGGLTELVNELN